jgi:hypothetical protein
MSRDHLRRLSSRGSCTTGKDDTARRFLSEVTCGENHDIGADVLPSCNDGAAKHAISDFVERVTREGVPTAHCTFDNDGSLWAEKPVPLQVLNAFDRISCLAPEHPNWHTKQPFPSIPNGDMVSVSAAGEAPREEDDCDHIAMTTEEFSQSISEWTGTARHPQTKRLYTEMVYQPMLELLTYLRVKSLPCTVAVLLMVTPVRAQQATPPSAPAVDATALAKQSQNPVGSLVSVSFQSISTPAAILVSGRS